MIQYPLYSLSTKMLDATKSKTKSISGINLPDMTETNRSAIGSDLYKIGQLIARTSNYNFNKAELVTREEVTYSG